MSYLDGAVNMSVAGGGCDATIDSLFLRNDALTDDGQPVRGIALCANSISSGVCDSFWIGINYAAISAQSAANGGDGWNVIVNLIKTIRHEVGHSVGLDHDTGVSAMKESWVPTDLAYTIYTAHDIDHVNNAHEPGGVLDNVIPTATGYRAQGWTIDPDAVQPFWSFVRVVVDATPTTADANGYRPDVHAVYPHGPYHGFDVAVSSGPGWHYVCAYGVNSGSAGPGTDDVLLDCRWVFR